MCIHYIFFLPVTPFFGSLNMPEPLSRQWLCTWIFFIKITHPPSKVKWSSPCITCGLMDQFHPLSLMLQSKWATFFDITGYPSNSIFISADPDLTWVCYHIWPFVLFVLIDFLQTSLMLKWKTLIGKIWSNMESRLRGERVRYSSSLTVRLSKIIWVSLRNIRNTKPFTKSREPEIWRVHKYE